MMLRKLNWLLVAGVLVLLSGCQPEEEAYSEELRFLTEDYRPFNYSAEGELTGLAADVLREICDHLKIPFEVEVLPWTDAYSEAQQSADAVLFSTVLNPERQDLFQWAGPFASIDWVFYQAPRNSMTLTSLAAAKSVGNIGVLADYSIEQYLVDQGFDNLVYCASEADGFRRLLNGEIDLFPANALTAEGALESIDENIYSVKVAMPLLTDLLYFAFNREVPNQVVADFQEQIDRMKDGGFLRTLSEKYLKTSDFPGRMSFYTEQYPPLTYRDVMGDITGFGTDIIREIMQRNQSYYPIRLSTWSNGYQLALTNPNVCLFTMDRTEIRENLFQWVGPIGTNTSWFYIRSGSGIQIASLEDAQALSSVGVVDSWFSTQYLIELGFTNLVGTGSPEEMTELLMAGTVDACVVTDVTFPDILQSLGYPYSAVQPAFDLMSSDYYIAFSNSTDPAVVSQWQDDLDEMKDDGIYEAIRLKWFPE